MSQVATEQQKRTEVKPFGVLHARLAKFDFKETPTVTYAYSRSSMPVFV
jgi:hypothetical protein